MNHMNSPTPPHHSMLAQEWRTALPGLIGSTLAAVLSALAILAALWFVVLLISHISWHWLACALICWLSAALLDALSVYLAHRAETQFSGRLRLTIAQHLLRLPSDLAARQNEQTLKQLLLDDIASLHHLLAHLPAEIAVFTVIPLLSSAILFHFIGAATLWVLLPGILASLYYLLLMPYIARRDGMARMQVMRDIINKADEYIRGIPVYRIYGQQPSALTAYTQATEHFTHNMVGWVAKVATPAALAVALLQAVATFAIAYWVSHNDNTTTLAATLLFSLAVVTPALRLGHGLDYISAGKAAIKRLNAFLQQPLLSSGTVSQLNQLPTLTLNEATLQQEEHTVFQHLSYAFPVGAITAITGASGSGKTSLLNALAGLLPLTSGQIEIGQTDLTALQEQLRHQLILLIPQGHDVLDRSIRANLALTAPQASDEILQQALEKVQLAADLDAPASCLSGGEQQRLGMARVLLSTAPIILLDEPTSALDHEHAQQLMHLLQQLATTEHKTIVMVTHDRQLAASAQAQLHLDRTRNQA